MKRPLIIALLAAMMVMASATAAFAGEVNGSKNGKDGSWSTPAPSNARSACVYSGLEDSEADGAVQGQHGTVQNWGHTKDALLPDGITPIVVDSPDNHGASQVLLDFGEGEFLWGCNPHVGAEG